VIFRTRPGRPWCPPSLLYNAYRVFFAGVKRPERGVDHPPHLLPRLKKEKSYTSTPSLGLRGLLEVELYLYLYSLPTTLPVVGLGPLHNSIIGPPPPFPMIIKQITPRSPTALPSIRRTYSPKEPVTNVTILYFGGGATGTGSARAFPTPLDHNV
jgi:hypothetical protein